MKKIIMYIDSMMYGGAQRVMSNLIEYFSNRKIEVILVNDFKVPKGEREYIIPTSVKRYYLNNKIKKNKIITNFQRVVKLRKIIINENPEIVLSFLGRVNFRMLISTIGLNCKKVISVRNDPNEEYGKTWYRKKLANILFKLADFCIFQTKDAVKYFDNDIKKKSAIIINPVDEKFYNIQRSKEPKDIITIGRLEKQKNHRLLIDAFYKIMNKIPNEKLLIYGEGTQRERLQKYINKLELQNKVILKGRTENVPFVLSKSLLFVLSSDYEGLPNALMEAMAVGVPCISTDCPCGGPRELIKDNKDGILIPCNDSDILAKKILEAINNQEIFNSKIRAQEFRQNLVCTNWEEILKNI